MNDEGGNRIRPDRHRLHGSFPPLLLVCSWCAPGCRALTHLPICAACRSSRPSPHAVCCATSLLRSAVFMALIRARAAALSACVAGFFFSRTRKLLDVLEKSNCSWSTSSKGSVISACEHHASRITHHAPRITHHASCITHHACVCKQQMTVGGQGAHSRCL